MTIPKLVEALNILHSLVLSDNLTKEQSQAIIALETAYNEYKDKISRRNKEIADLKFRLSNNSFLPIKNNRFKWIVEFEVDKCWVEDGFDLNNDRALEMLANDLQYANVGIELGAKVLKTPDPKIIRKTQGYTD